MAQSAFDLIAETDQHALSDEVVSFHITSLHHDDGSRDRSYLYDLTVWVR